uniref:Cystatin domain-containing protein n=1 Tax=Elaeophora elaphi TaxID=1147741 RepID=A0A0R3RRT1_9BILA
MLRFLVVLLALFISFSNAQYENDPDVKDVVNDSMRLINKYMEGENLWKLRSIVRAKVLVVLNTIYDVTLILTPTTCKKGQKIKSLSKCPIDKRRNEKKVFARISESINGKITVKMG